MIPKFKANCSYKEHQLTRLMHADATCGSRSPKPFFASTKADEKKFSASTNFP